MKTTDAQKFAIKFCSWGFTTRIYRWMIEKRKKRESRHGKKQIMSHYPEEKETKMKSVSVGSEIAAAAALLCGRWNFSSFYILLKYNSFLSS